MVVHFSVVCKLLNDLDLNAKTPTALESRNKFIENIAMMPKYLTSFFDDGVTYRVMRSKNLTDTLQQFMLKNDNKY